MEKLKCLESGIEAFVTLLKGGLVARSLISRAITISALN